MKKRILSFVLVILVLFLSLPRAFADDLTKKQDQLKEVQENMDELRDKIKNLQGERKSVLNELDRLDAQIDRAEGELDKIDNQIGITNSSIDITSRELDKAIKEYEEHKDLYSDRLRAMYMNGPSGYLEILFSAKSFSDFLSRTEIVKKIMNYDTNLLSDMKDRQEDIEGKKKQLEAKKSELIKLQNSYQAKKNDLDDINKKKKNYYSKLSKDQKQYEKALLEEEKMSKQLTSDIQKLLASRSKNSNLKYNGKRYAILKESEAGRSIPTTSLYGMRYHPVLKRYKLHTGIDFGVPTGTPVHAMADGEVIIAKYLSGYGNTVVIDHGSGITSLYAHNSKLLVSEGQTVKGGQVISKSGSTGYSTGPHCHFEVRVNGDPVNPEGYYIIGQ